MCRVRGVESLVRATSDSMKNPIPSIKKQSEIIAKIDELLGRQQDITKTLNEMRETLLVEWSVRGDKRQFLETMQAAAWGESWAKQAPQKARTYFTRVIDEWRQQQVKP